MITQIIMIIMALAIVALVCNTIRYEYMFRAVEDEVEYLLSRIVEVADDLDAHIWSGAHCGSEFNDETIKENDKRD